MSAALTDFQFCDNNISYPSVRPAQHHLKDLVERVIIQRGINSSMEVYDLVKDLFYNTLENACGLYSSEMPCHLSQLRMCIRTTLSLIGSPLSMYVKAIFCVQGAKRL